MKRFSKSVLTDAMKGPAPAHVGQRIHERKDLCTHDDLLEIPSVKLQLLDGFSKNQEKYLRLVFEFASARADLEISQLYIRDFLYV